MNHNPIRVYEQGQTNLEIGQKTSNLTLSPQMKRKLQPLADNASLLQLASASQKKTPIDSPIKSRIKTIKNSLQDVEKKEPTRNEKQEQPDMVKLINNRNLQRDKAESFSPPKRTNQISLTQNPEKFFLKGNFQMDQHDQVKLPTLPENASPNQRRNEGILKRNMTPSKQIQLISQNEKKELTKSQNIESEVKKQNKGDLQKTEKRDTVIDANIVNTFIFNLLKKIGSVIQKNEQNAVKIRKMLQDRERVNAKNTLTGNVSGLLHSRSSSHPQLIQKELLEESKESGNKNVVKYLVQKQNNLIVKRQRTQAGQNSNKQTKTNQDSIIQCSPFNGLKNRYYLGVCDGHGAYGHFVSQTIKKILPQNLDTFLKAQFGKTASVDDLGLKEENQVLRSFAQAFQKTSKEINSCGIDVSFSGTTCVTVLLSGPNIWCANIGDSRAVIYYQKDDMWNIQPLSNDHKPENLSEKKRILQAKGRVEPFYQEDGEPVGPPRVWLLHDQVPGLAMSRSFGDYIASTVGVVSDPEVTYFKVDFEVGFLVIASDGVWEFLTNQNVCEILQTHFQKGKEASNQLLEVMAGHIIKESTKMWLQEDEVIDDISVQIAYLTKSQ